MNYPVAALDTSLTVAAVGVAIAVIQITLGLRRDRFDNTFRMIEWLQNPNILLVRNSTSELINKAKAVDFDFYLLSAEERANLSAVSNLFGYTGLLAKKRRINREIILAGWARHIAATYERMGPYFDWRHSLAGGESLHPYFEWLDKEARNYIRRAEPKSKSMIKKRPTADSHVHSSYFDELI